MTEESLPTTVGMLAPPEFLEGLDRQVIPLVETLPCFCYNFSDLVFLSSLGWCFMTALFTQILQVKLTLILFRHTYLLVTGDTK